MELHPAPSDPGYAAHVEQLAINIGLSQREVEDELASLRRRAAREKALELLPHNDDLYESFDE